jgi:hypothetical protein
MALSAVWGYGQLPLSKHLHMIFHVVVVEARLGAWCIVVIQIKRLGLQPMGEKAAGMDTPAPGSRRDRKGG